jgi:hypothetical protein
MLPYTEIKGKPFLQVCHFSEKRQLDVDTKNRFDRFAV